MSAVQTAPGLPCRYQAGGPGQIRLNCTQMPDVNYTVLLGSIMVVKSIKKAQPQPQRSPSKSLA